MLKAILPSLSRMSSNKSPLSSGCVTLGIFVQYEWGKALFPAEEVSREFVSNLFLLLLGLFLLALFVVVTKTVGFRNTLRIIMVVACVFLVLSFTPLAVNGISERALHIGIVTIPTDVVIALIYIMLCSVITNRYGKDEALFMFLMILILTILALIGAAILGSAAKLIWVLPVIAYCLMYPYLGKQIWYRFLPVLFVLIILGRIVYVYLLPEERVLSYQDSLIAAWLHPDSEKYDGYHYTWSTFRSMIASGGVAGNKVAMQSDVYSYRDGSSLLLIGLFQRLGIIGFMIALLLFTVMCRSIIRIGINFRKAIESEKRTICTGIGIFMIAVGICSVLSGLNILPLRSVFCFPFLCSDGFTPLLYIYLAIVIAASSDRPQEA